MSKILFRFILFFSVVFTDSHAFNQPFIDVAKNQSPAIVSILTETTTNIGYHPFFDDPFFKQFDFPDPYLDEYQSESLGSGVIIDNENGYILTNNHVIDGADEIKVILYDKQEFIATVVGVDPLSDIAVIQINIDDNKNNLVQVNIGNSDSLQIGEWVIAIGSPFGLHLDHTVTAGIVSAKGRSDIMSRINYENFIQHDAAINPGNSGGGLFNLNGELIGINTAIATDGYSRSNAGVGFAIPINQIKYGLDDLINLGSISRGWLGVQIRDIDDDMVRALGLDSKKGVMVVSIFDNSAADKAGFMDKDVIVAMNYNPIVSGNDLKNKVSLEKPGSNIVFTIIRNKTKMNINAILDRRPDQDEIVQSYNNSLEEFDLLGFKVTDRNLDGVEIIEINSNSNAIKKNIKIGDLITEIGNYSISNKEEYFMILQQYYEKGDIIMLKINTQGISRYEAFEIN